ncbi:MAG: hypothetical protein ACODAB_02275, partial [Gemmatimonadota bacterium]
LCAGLEDLIEFSVAVARDETLGQRVAREARRRSLDFAPHVFEERIRHYVSRALARHRGTTDLAEGETR